MKGTILVLIDTLHRSGAEKVAIDLSYYLSINSEKRIIVCATREGGGLENTLKKNNVKYYIINRNKKFEFFKMLKVIKIIKMENVDLIHSHKFGSNFWAVILGFLFNKKVIVHVHGQDYKRKDKLYKIINKIISKGSSLVIAVSNMEKKLFSSFTNIDEKKITVIHNGSDINSSNVKKRKSDVGTEKVIGIIAALRPEKNIDMFLYAASRIVEERPNTKFYIVGDGSERERLEDLSKKLKLNSHVMFTGFRENIHSYLSLFDVGVLCSTREGLPVVLVEYLLSQVPVVSTKVGGVEEIIQDGYNGILIPSEDYNILAEKVLALLDDNITKEKLVSNGYNFAISNLTLQKMSETVNHIYDELLLK